MQWQVSLLFKGSRWWEPNFQFFYSMVLLHPWYSVLSVQSAKTRCRKLSGSQSIGSDRSWEGMISEAHYILLRNLKPQNTLCYHPDKPRYFVNFILPWNGKRMTLKFISLFDLIPPVDYISTWNLLRIQVVAGEVRELDKRRQALEAELAEVSTLRHNLVTFSHALVKITQDLRSLVLGITWHWICCELNHEGREIDATITILARTKFNEYQTIVVPMMAGNVAIIIFVKHTFVSKLFGKLTRLWVSGEVSPSSGYCATHQYSGRERTVWCSQQQYRGSFVDSGFYLTPVFSVWCMCHLMVAVLDRGSWESPWSLFEVCALKVCDAIIFHVCSSIRFTLA